METKVKAFNTLEKIELVVPTTWYAIVNHNNTVVVMFADKEEAKDYYVDDAEGQKESYKNTPRHILVTLMD